MIVTGDEELAAKVRSLRSHGLTHSTWSRHQGGTPGYDVVEAGWNFRPTEITAALGLVQLDKLPEGQVRRARIVRRYYDRFAALPEVGLPFRRGGYWAESAHHIFPILLPGAGTRDRVREHLLRKRVQISHHYNPIHLFQYYRDRVPTASVRLPHTEAYADRELTLPLHPGMADEQVDWIVDQVREALTG
jgi:dTDP-4-amino-4,6-dideoxygalactose transaminase